MTSSEVVAQNGHFKHPYLYALVRWLVSSFWSSATLLLHRLVIAPLPPVTGPSLPRSKPRPASSDHLHPEPLVESVILHTPDNPSVDVVFVHGLYGSLGNTWRQGEWKTRYRNDPQKVPLRRPHSVNTCMCEDDEPTCDNDLVDADDQSNDKDDEMVMRVGEDIYNNISKMLPDADIYITDKFYNNTLLDQVEIVGNYDTQADFVRELFECDNQVGVDDHTEHEGDHNRQECERAKSETLKQDCLCKERRSREDCDAEQTAESDRCEVGCGCVCDDCYSPCWPRDWIRADYPGARIISINYTSDPHLWRPLWVKQSKRLQLHERAEQMMAQLLELGVGDRPIIWVGHSKGGLFIKQLYCEAYEAHKKINPEEKNRGISNVDENEQKITINNNINTDEDLIRYNSNKCDNTTGFDVYINNNNDISEDDNENNEMEDFANYNVNNDCFINDNNFDISDKDYSHIHNINSKRDNNYENNDLDIYNSEKHLTNIPVFKETCSDVEGDLLRRSRLWVHSAGFMFYSVPHRGSPLADIKTPITARSVELMEICKDCNLVLSLQERWLRASAGAQPKVRSLVETCKTLMSVLWLRIVSVDSADPGIGSVYGVNVDHREICKPASRHCPLYRELMALMSSALRTPPTGDTPNSL